MKIKPFRTSASYPDGVGGARFTLLSKITNKKGAKIYEMINQKSKYYDSTFPKPVRLSESRIGWSAWEINQWIEDKLENRE